MNKVKMYDGITIDMKTSEVISHGEVSYVDAKDVVKLKGGDQTSTTQSGFSDPAVSEMLQKGLGLYESGAFDNVAGFTDLQKESQALGVEAAGRQTGIEQQLLDNANVSYEDSAQFTNTQAALNQASAGHSGSLGGSSNLFNKSQITAAGASAYDQQKAGALSNALSVQGTGAQNLAGIGAYQQAQEQKDLDKYATGWQKFAAPLSALSGKTSTTTTSGSTK